MNVTGHTIRLVIFDLDGTLIHSPLDLGRLRGHLGLEDCDLPLLEAVQQMPPPSRRQALGVIGQHERSAASQSIPAWRAGQTIRLLRRNRINAAILSRNHRQTILSITKRLGLAVDQLIGREDAPIKPHPGGVLRICRSLGIRPSGTLVVGDHWLDLVTARRAGAVPVLISHDRHPRDWDHMAARVIWELPEVVDMALGGPGAYK